MISQKKKQKKKNKNKKKKKKKKKQKERSPGEATAHIAPGLSTLAMHCVPLVSLGSSPPLLACYAAQLVSAAASQ
ncbi:unnamed protein product [Schistocephalus solidus]|uniref:Uncharacterized protein n=1 Tax=Schistocephalus solidus TaxID=70667 RepID=A0A183TNK5_SCHSO|nr:unnamed protein product [Schistocephalus solidus]